MLVFTGDEMLDRECVRNQWIQLVGGLKNNSNSAYYYFLFTDATGTCSVTLIPKICELPLSLITKKLVRNYPYIFK